VLANPQLVQMVAIEDENKPHFRLDFKQIYQTQILLKGTNYVHKMEVTILNIDKSLEQSESLDPQNQTIK